MIRRSLALSAVSGLVLAVSFPDAGLSLLAWFALVPLLLAIRGQSLKDGLLSGFTFGLVFFCCTLHWVSHSLHTHGRLPLLSSISITLFLCIFLALFSALFGGAVSRVKTGNPYFYVLAIPACWVAMELARTHLFSGFPWLLLGYSQHRSLPVIQIADLAGVFGVSFIIMVVNSGIAGIFFERRQYTPLLIAIALLAAVLGYGYSCFNASEGLDRIKIAVVQGNIDQDRKWDRAYQNHVIETYERLTLKALMEKPDLIIWPETATPFYFGSADGPNPLLTDDLRRFVRSLRTPLLTGSATLERTHDRSPVLRNSAILLKDDGATSAVYNKIHLVPFGEYVPFKSILSFVKKLTEGDIDFQPGSEHTIMQVRRQEGSHVAIGTVICYEVIFPDLVRQFVNNGASIIANITNDAWFGRTGAPHQHFSMAVLRAVENRVPVVRAANTGVSGFIDTKGRILDSSGIFTEAVLTKTITPSTIRSFYRRHGDVFAWGCVFVSIYTLLATRHKQQ